MSQWKPGQSGNPQGSNKKSRERVQRTRELAGDEVEACIAKLVQLRDGDDPRTAYLATIALLERAVGKARSPIEDEALEQKAILDEARTRDLDIYKKLEDLDKKLDAGEKTDSLRIV